LYRHPAKERARFPADFAVTKRDRYESVFELHAKFGAYNRTPRCTPTDRLFGIPVTKIPDRIFDRIFDAKAFFIAKNSVISHGLQALELSFLCVG
jgi:hypothetical protein